MKPATLLHSIVCCVKKNNEVMKIRVRTKEYISWMQMKSRCDNPKHPKFNYYGGRGITYCDSWAYFKNFISDMGLAPTKDHTLDRYPDVNGNYGPSNCRWADRKQQQRNRSNNRLITINNETKTLAEWSEISGLDTSTIKRRLENDIDTSELLKPYTELKDQIKAIFETKAWDYKFKWHNQPMGMKVETISSLLKRIPVKTKTSIYKPIRELQAESFFTVEKAGRNLVIIYEKTIGDAA